MENVKIRHLISRDWMYYVGQERIIYYRELAPNEKTLYPHMKAVGWIGAIQVFVP